jgi:hypothetical protein
MSRLLNLVAIIAISIPGARATTADIIAKRHSLALGVAGAAIIEIANSGGHLKDPEYSAIKTAVETCFTLGYANNKAKIFSLEPFLYLQPNDNWDDYKLANIYVPVLAKYPDLASELIKLKFPNAEEAATVDSAHETLNSTSAKDSDKDAALVSLKPIVAKCLGKSVDAFSPSDLSSFFEQMRVARGYSIAYAAGWEAARYEKTVWAERIALGAAITGAVVGGLWIWGKLSKPSQSASSTRSSSKLYSQAGEVGSYQSTGSQKRGTKRIATTD